MARLNCPDCPKTFKGEGGLSWHRERNHLASSSAEGTFVPVIVSQEAPVKASAGPEDPEWWPSVDDLFEEDEPLALHDLLNRGFPELSTTVEALAKSLDQALSEREADRLKVRDLESKVAALEALTTDITRRLGEQVTRGDRLERRAEIVANPELYTGVPDPMTKAVVPASLGSRLRPARLSQSFLDTILHAALGTATSIAVARVMSASVIPAGAAPDKKEEDKGKEKEPTLLIIADEPTLTVIDDREPPVSNAFVEGDQGHLDPEFLRDLMEDLDRILRDPDKMGEVDVATLRVTRE